LREIAYSIKLKSYPYMNDTDYELYVKQTLKGLDSLNAFQQFIINFDK
jgi:hypothetical protein